MPKVLSVKLIDASTPKGLEACVNELVPIYQPRGEVVYEPKQGNQPARFILLMVRYEGR